MRALITGINGMDGSHLADLLLTKGYKVFGMERRTSSPNRTNTKHLEGKITFVNGDLPPHNMVVNGHPELSHSDLSFMGGESFEVTFPESGEYEFQCEPHAGAGMKGVIHVE